MVFNNFKEIKMGGEVFELGNPEWRGAQAVLEIQVDGGGGQKTVPSVVGVWIFSGITHCPSSVLMHSFSFLLLAFLFVCRDQKKAWNKLFCLSS